MCCHCGTPDTIHAADTGHDTATSSFNDFVRVFSENLDTKLATPSESRTHGFIVTDLFSAGGHHCCASVGDGSLLLIYFQRADIIVAPLSVMAERENVIDFTVPYYDLVGITILMRKPVFKYELFKFMNVLEEKVWGCVFSAFIIVSILLSLFDKYSPYSYQNNKKTWDGKGDEPRVFTLKEGLWFCMTSLTPQGMTSPYSTF